MTETERFELRARDAVSRLLLLRLTVPRIYFDAPWPSAAHRADVLAIDRGGSGDVHVVEIKYDAEKAVNSLPHLLTIAAQFKWIAFFTDDLNGKAPDALREALLPQNGMGRVGAIAVFQTAGGNLGAKVAVSPERFAGSYRAQITEFVRANEPDITVDNLEPSETTPAVFAVPDPASFLSKLSEVHRLLDEGHDEAGFLIAWLLFESILRLLAQREGLWTEGQPAGAMIRSLHAHGLLSDADYDVAKTALETRNALLHGRRPAKQLAASATDLTKAADRLVAQIRGAQHTPA